MEKHIITGGPGTGKTTLLDHLAANGHTTVPETARILIERELAKEKQDPTYAPIVPWRDLAGFQEYILPHQVEAEKAVSGRAFLDRALPDSIAYARLGNVELSDTYDEEIERAQYGVVFFLEQLHDYHRDEARREEKQVADMLHNELYAAYDRLGFHIVPVPVYPGSKEECTRRRAEHVLSVVETIEKHLRSESGVEFEGKYPLKNEGMLEGRLNYYPMRRQKPAVLTDTYYSLPPALENEFRVREQEQSYLLTLKGPNTSSQIKACAEQNKALSVEESSSIRERFPATGYVQKIRLNYVPVFDQTTTISIDTVAGLGKFVEIEAPTEAQVLRWKERLGITADSIQQSYRELLS